MVPIEAKDVADVSEFKVVTVASILSVFKLLKFVFITEREELSVSLPLIVVMVLPRLSPGSDSYQLIGTYLATPRKVEAATSAVIAMLNKILTFLLR